jgi:hypothetical protein
MDNPAIAGQITAILVSTVFFLFCGAVVIGTLYFRNRAREMRHQTIRIALEKGQPLPPDLLEVPRRPGSDLATGVKLIALGGGISLFLYLEHLRAWASGLVLVALGAGYLVSHALTRTDASGPATGAGSR